MNDHAPEFHQALHATARHPTRMLVLSQDPCFADEVAACGRALAMSSSHVHDPQEATEALALEASELAIVDAAIGLQDVLNFVRRLRLGLCGDWLPLLVAGDPSRLGPQLRQLAPGMVDRVVAKPLVHEELSDSLASARRTVSLRRAYDSTLDRVSEAVIVIDENGRIRSFNTAAQRLFQWSSAEMLGESVKRLMPDRARREHDGYMAHYLLTGQAQIIGKGRFETGQRRDGSQFPMHLTVTDISDTSCTRFVGVIRDLTRDREADDLRQRALRDDLTGLANAAHAREALFQACEAARRGGEDFALVFMDLDRFKPVNDEHGHAIGDQVLRTVAHRLRHNLGESDVVARMGGDEFLALLRDVPHAATAEAVARRIQTAVTQPISVGGHTVSVGMSVGIALHGTHGTTPESLLQAADEAMYAHKRRGTSEAGRHHPGSDAR